MNKIKVPDERLLDYLQVWKDRDEIVYDSGIKRTTVYDKLARLLKAGKVKSRTRRGKGRPRVLWKRCLGEYETD